MRELSDQDIQKQFVNEPLFGGVLNKSSLSELGQKAYVFNLDSVKGPGTHWVMMSNIDPNYVFYGDSFGQPAPQHLTTLMKKTNKRIIINEKQIQDIDSTSCGWFCIMFIRQLIKGYKPKMIIDWFTDDTKLNEKKLENYFGK